MAQLIPGTIFKTPGFSTRDLPYGFGVSAEEIIQKNYKDNAKLGFIRLMVWNFYVIVTSTITDNFSQTKIVFYRCECACGTSTHSWSMIFWISLQEIKSEFLCSKVVTYENDSLSNLRNAQHDRHTNEPTNKRTSTSTEQPVHNMKMNKMKII